MNAINKKYLVVLTILSQICFSQSLTVSKINQPYKVYFKNVIKEVKRSYRKYPEVCKQIIDDKTYFYNRRIQLGNSILDTINIKNSDIIIIDEIFDNNGERQDISYFFYENKIVRLRYEKEETIKNNKVYYDYIPYADQIQFKDINHDTMKVYEYFNKNNLDDIKGSIDFGKFVTFNVTKTLNSKVELYLIRSSADGIIITKSTENKYITKM